MKRRHLVLGTLAAGGALAVGWGLLPPRQRLMPSRPPPLQAGQLAVNGWLKLTADDRVIVVMPRSEMGQGAHTALAMLLAEELDADWGRVRIEPAPIDPIYFNQATVVDGLPFHPDSRGVVKRAAGWMTAKTMREIGVMVTGGSSSVKDAWEPMRLAGASARAMLVAAAARAWGVPEAEVFVRDGLLSHGGKGRQARFGELAEAASRLPVPREPALKKPADFRLIGRPTRRLDSAAKSRGEAGYGLDLRLPGMLHATVAMSPVAGGGVAAFDAKAALARPGVRDAFVVAPGFGAPAAVAVLADSHWRARQALAQLQVQWDEAVPAAGLSSADVLARLRRELDAGSGFPYFSEGDVDAAFAGAARTLRAEYDAPYLAHLALEPINCTVQVGNGEATVWAPTQVPDLARRAAAQALDLPADKVTVHVTLLGGGFGRRLDVDFVWQAALIAARAPGTPVMTLWTREQDTRHDFYRPAAAARWEAALDAQGRLLALRALSASQSVVQQSLTRLFGLPAAGPDKTAAEGAFDQPYAWPAARIAHRIVELPLPVGFWRSVGHSHQAFFKESFVDELAHAAGQDPLGYRLALLQHDARSAGVLQLAAAGAGWGTPAPAAPDGAPVARGIAFHRSFGTRVGMVVEASLAPEAAAGQGSPTRAIRVHRVVCAVDCGQPVNPDGIRQQVEGGVQFALAAALHGGVTFERGRVREGNFDAQPMPRLADAPRVEVQIVASHEPPEGMGEPPVPPLAPALAGALFALTGQRPRSLPLKPA